ncbi:MAG: heavy metal transport/detoxification protein [uncultured bacterium]|nr:MAG: heavy metal transport/detoxification protein [uncultured bacterium]
MVSGGFIGGALIMGAFALGTFPVLLGIGLGSTYTKGLKSGLGGKFIGILIVIFAIYSFNNVLKIEGVSLIPSFGESVPQVEISENGYQEVHMTVDYGFEPDEFTIKKDVPVKWIINGENISGCVSSIIVPDLDLSFKLKEGEQIIEFTPTEAGNIYFSCSMGMVSGSFNVIE